MLCDESGCCTAGIDTVDSHEVADGASEDEKMPPSAEVSVREQISALRFAALHKIWKCAHRVRKRRRTPRGANLDRHRQLSTSRLKFVKAACVIQASDRSAVESDKCIFYFVR